MTDNIDFRAIKATQRNLELQGYIVCGRFAYRGKASDPTWRILNDGSLKKL